MSKILLTGLFELTNATRPLRVFLCHASGDKPAVRTLYERLVRDGIDAWLDKEKLLPGQNWQIEIPKAVISSDVVIVCLSSHSITKEGFVQKEIRIALDAADEKPDGTIFIIPGRLENCDVPERINKFQWVDLFSTDGYEWLLKALQRRATSVGAIITPEKEKNEAQNLGKFRTPSKISGEQRELKKTVITSSQKRVKAPKKALSEKPVESRKSQDESFFPREGICLYISNEYLRSPKGKNVGEFAKQGTLRLTQDSFVFSSENFYLNIDFRSIESIERIRIPLWSVSPYDANCFAIYYAENKNNVLIGLFPASTALKPKSESTWEMNRSAEEWLEYLRGIPQLLPKIKESRIYNEW